MSTFGIDGLISGLKTTDLINQLMQVEAAPQALLKSKQTATQSLVTGLQSLNTKIASLGDAATKAAAPASWDAFVASSSSATVTTASSAAAQPGSLTFTVDAVAAAQVTVTATTPDDGTFLPGTPPALTVRKADGTLVTVQPATGSLADIADALNDSADAGVRATVVRVSDGETPTYRLQLTGAATGEANAFEVYAGTTQQVTDALAGGTAVRIDSGLVRAASDAMVTLWKGTAVEKSFEQASNTFTGLMSGVDVTVSKVTGATDEPVTVTVARDDTALKALASGLVGAIGVVLSEISSRTAVTTKANSDGTTTVTGGLFTGDSAVRGLQQMVIEAASYPVDDVSPSTVGITLGKDGAFTFDEKVFAAAMAEDPAHVQSVVAGLAARVSAVATSVSDKYEGSLTLKIKGQQDLASSMGTQIEDWDRRLAVRRESLQRTYSALEVTLSNLQAQSSWLAGQLGSLMSSSGD